MPLDRDRDLSHPCTSGELEWLSRLYPKFDVPRSVTKIYILASTPYQGRARICRAWREAVVAECRSLSEHFWGRAGDGAMQAESLEKNRFPPEMCALRLEYANEFWPPTKDAGRTVPAHAKRAG